MEGLGASLGVLGGLWRDFGRFLWRHWGEDGRIMGQVGAKLAASCSQDGPCQRQDGHVELSLRGFGGIFEAFFEHFGRCAGYEKTLKNLWFFYVFRGFGWLDGMAEASWRLS